MNNTQSTNEAQNDRDFSLEPSNDEIQRVFKKYFIDYFLDFNDKRKGQNRLNRYIFRGIPGDDSIIQSSAAYRLKNDAKRKKDKYHQIDFIAYHQNLIEQSKKNIAGLSSTKLSDIEILAEIQHYGGATCLIDFSFNYLIALYFASRSYLKDPTDKGTGTESNSEANSKTGEKTKVESDGTLFIVDLYDPDNEKIFLLNKKYQKKNIEEILMKRELYGDFQKPRMWMWQPYNLNNRIMKQDSVFLFSMAKVENDQQKGNIEYLNKPVKAEDKEVIRFILSNYFNISAETIFEDIQGYASLSNGREIEVNNNFLKHGTCLTYGRELYRQEDFISAENVLNNGIICCLEENDQNRKCKNKCDRSNLAEIYFFKALTLKKLRNYHGALITFDNSLKQFNNLLNNKDSPRLDYYKQRMNTIHIEELETYYILEEFEKALQYCEEVIRKPLYLEDNLKKIKFILSIIELSLIIGDNCKEKYEENMKEVNRIIGEENIINAITKFELFKDIGEIVFGIESNNYSPLKDSFAIRDPEKDTLIEWNYKYLYNYFKHQIRQNGNIPRKIKECEEKDRKIYEKYYLAAEDF